MTRFRTTLGFSLLLASVAAGPVVAGSRYATSDSGSASRSDAYRAGQQALEREDWGDASVIFGKIANGAGAEADAALYWKAYADWKQVKKKESLEGLQRLRSSYPKSAWADDADALEQDIRGGTAANASSVEDEELKLYALDGLMQMDPEKAVPTLEKLLAGNSTERVKQRALFVLSQSASPRAREILVRTAKSGQPVSLRREAVKTLGISGTPEDIAALASIARDTNAPPEVRNAVIEAYLIAGRQDELYQLATSDPEPRIRLKAIEALGAIGALPQLRKLWSTEQDPAVKRKLLETFGVYGDVETLAKVARETSDREVRRKAIEGLGVSGSPEANRALRQMYGEFSAVEDRKKILEGFMIQGDAKTLVELFRIEKDPAMKKAIIQQLSIMDDPAATQMILEVLGAKP